MTTAGKPRGRPPGEVRQSQLITTYGPGALVDLPNHAVIVGGLELWQGERKRIFEERLETRVATLLALPEVALYNPPLPSDAPGAAQAGIVAVQFPGWFLAQVNETWTDRPSGKSYRTRPLLPWNALVKGHYLNAEKKKVPVVPVRFVQACVNGHIGDIDWPGFVHAGGERGCHRRLWLDEGGSGADFSEIFVRCECGARRGLSKAAAGEGLLGRCKGARPWLGGHAAERCVSTKDPALGEPNRLLVRSATNAWFSQVLSVIALPDRDGALRHAVDRVYDDFLQYAESEAEVGRERRKAKVGAALDGFGDAAVFAELQRRKAGRPAPAKKVKEAEIETLLACPPATSALDDGDDAPDGDFYARSIALDPLPGPLRERLERVVLVHRLREVAAIVGFTRFEATMPDIDGELDIHVKRAALAVDPTWVPAIENRGEGLFLAFRAAAVEAWRTRPAVQKHGLRLEAGFKAWCRRKDAPDARFPELPYIMLHSLAHLLITTLALECGYSATAIRERVYAGPAGYGILLYTGTPGAEGTLGGLVALGRRLGTLIPRALELGRLCSNDPVCAQHEPENVNEERFLHGAACHGCLLIGEPSCERRNEFLDRALVVPTVAGLGAEFFA